MKRFLLRHIADVVLALYLAAILAGTFIGGLWAALGIGGGLMVFLSVGIADKKIPWPQPDLTLMAIAFFAIVAFLNVQSSQPALSWHEWIRLGTVFVPLLFLFNPVVKKPGDHSRFFVVLPVAIIAAGLTLAGWLYYLKAHNVITPEFSVKLAKYNRGFSYLVLLSFPVLASVWFSKNRWLVIPFLLLLLIPAGLTESRSAKLALMVGLAITVCAHMAPIIIQGILALTTMMAIGWPFAARALFLEDHSLLGRLPDSWRARVEIWDYMSYRIEEKPWLGWGLGTSHGLDFVHPHGALYVITTMPAAHPHNVMTQLWVELGLPGLVLGVAFAFLTLRKAGRFDRRLVPFALGAWTTGLCLSLIAYDFWTDSLFAAFAFTALAFAILQNQSGSPPSMAAPETRQ